MIRRAIAGLLILAAFTASACEDGKRGQPFRSSQGTSTAVQENDCAGPSSQAEITASKSVFDKQCVIAVADQPLRLTFHNDDNFQHNFAILQGKGGESVYASHFLDGSITSTLDIPALGAGTYRFECNIHPFTMNGRFFAPRIGK